MGTNRKKKTSTIKISLEKFCKDNQVTILSDSPITVCQSHSDRSFSFSSHHDGIINLRPGVTHDRTCYAGTDEECLNKYTSLTAAIAELELNIGDSIFYGTQIEKYDEESEEYDGEHDFCVTDAVECCVVGPNHVIPVTSVSAALKNALEVMRALFSAQGYENEPLRKAFSIPEVKEG